MKARPWNLVRIMGMALLFLLVPARAQEADGTGEQLAVKNAETLKGLFAAMEDVDGRIAAKREELSTVASEEQKQELGAELKVLKERLAALRADFEKLATGVDQENFNDAGEAAIDLGEEVRELLRPVIGELKAATSKPRELEEMRNERERLAQREKLATKAVKRLEPLKNTLDGGEKLREELQSLWRDWDKRRGETSRQIEALDLRINERMAEEESIWGLISGTVANFCTNRGRNLLFAFFSFVASLVALRWLYGFVREHSPLHRRRRSSFLVRVLDVAIGGLSVVVAVLVAFGVLYAAGDWVLLTIGVIFIAGLAWAAKNALPAMFEQMKLILNLGPVREGERIVFDGIPWQVDELAFYCEFTNPELTGGVLRLPLRALVDRHSRPFSPKEQWFPTAANDWVLLSDGTYGKVITQTPEQVVVLQLGGTRTTYATGAFLALNPENLSHNFRVRVTFGIDYAHQAEVTSSILEIFRHRIEADLKAYAGEDGLVSLKVEFKEAGPSSLDLAVIADMAGKMGSRYQFLQRRIQRICVDVCNEHGFGIPFTQITVHQAE